MGKTFRRDNPHDSQNKGMGRKPKRVDTHRDLPDMDQNPYKDYDPYSLEEDEYEYAQKIRPKE